MQALSGAHPPTSPSKKTASLSLQAPHSPPPLEPPPSSPAAPALSQPESASRPEAEPRLPGSQSAAPSSRIFEWLRAHLPPSSPTLAGVWSALLAGLALTLWLGWLRTGAHNQGIHSEGSPLSPLVNLLDWALLAVHEGGHMIFLFLSFPEQIVILMGSGLELLFGLFFCLAALQQAKPWGIACGLSIFSVACWSVQGYIADASARALPLITGDEESHDWHNLIYVHWQKPGMQEWLADLVSGMGLGALLLAALALWLPARLSPPEPAGPDPRWAESEPDPRWA